MNFKRFSTSDNRWHDVPYYIHNTSTDTITTLPAEIYANDTTATVGLEGNTLQSSVPSPTSPVMPQGTGERTGNLFDKTATNTNNGYIPNGYVKADGTENTNRDYRASEYISVDASTAYTLYCVVVLNAPSVCFYDSDKNFISGVPYSGRVTVSFTTPQNAAFLRLSYRAIDEDAIMLNTGSTALPYENFGYKIPISSASTTTPVYLGEVETTRKIKKSVLTGKETGWTKNIVNENNAYYRAFSDYYRYNGLCSHYAIVDNVRAETGIFFGGTINFLTKLSDEIDTVDKWKSYLQQQYVAGTPVTVWYVLAKPETAVVNEPLRKIGDYADEVSGITIPTIAGTNTLSIGTTLQPSEVSVNYKGWHPVADVHERDSGQWD